MTVQGAGGQAGKRTSAENAEGAREFRKRPVIISAMQYDGANFAAISAWAGAVIAEKFDGGLKIVTLEGTMTADVGDWVIRGVQGEFYPCKPAIFAATYEPAANEVSAPGTGASRKDNRAG